MVHGMPYQAQFGAAVVEQQPVLRPAGEHPVGLVGPLGHQVVDQDADVTSGADNGGLP